MSKCMVHYCIENQTCPYCQRCGFHCDAEFYCGHVAGRTSYYKLCKLPVNIQAAKQALENVAGTQLTEGVKHDDGKLRFDLLPPHALEQVVKVLTFGAGKYGDRNWERGMNWSRLFGALNRHMWAWFSGQDKDSETGLSHLAHAACCSLMLLEYAIRNTGKDDRPYGEVQ